MTQKKLQLILEVPSMGVEPIQQVNFSADAKAAFANFSEGRCLEEGSHQAAEPRMAGLENLDMRNGDADVRSREARGGSAMESTMGRPRKTNIVSVGQAASNTDKPAAVELFPEVYPGGILNTELLDERTECIIGCYAVRLMRTGAFCQYEQGDLKQELRILVARKMTRFDPEQGDRYVFAGMIVDSGYKNMLKTRDRELSASHGFLSLQDCPGGCDEALGELLGVDDYIDMTTGGMIPSARKADFYEALQVFLESLDELDQRICKAIAMYGSAEKASKHTGISARTILWRLRHTIHDKAVEAGLDEILGGAR